MKPLNNHIIIIGFKSVGKSVIGRALASKLHKNFIDLDVQIEQLYKQNYHQHLTCRQIMKKHGQDFFRELEHQALLQNITSAPAVISLGGGAPLKQENQELMKTHMIIHVIAPRGTVFERIMMHGRPAYFSEHEDPLVTFNRLWDEREIIYKKLATFSIENKGSIEQAVDQILDKREQ